MSKVEYQIRVSHRYHKLRERFFRLLDAGTKFLSLGALVALVAAHINLLSVGVAVISGAATILAIVLDFPGAAARHDALAREFMTLLQQLTAGKLNATEAAAAVREIGPREPTVLRGLAQLCQDEQDAAEGQAIEAARLGLWRRLRAQLGFGEMHINWP